MRKIYLGDAVYAEFDAERFILTTSDGQRAIDTIILEPEVMERLIDWVNQVTVESDKAK
jgi:NADH:ubiquinone oxidoreductase subunit B-like Fe-S oxidoreductase